MRRRVVFPPKLAVLHNSIQFSSSSRDGRSIMSSEERHIENWVIFEGEREREREGGGHNESNSVEADSRPKNPRDDKACIYSYIFIFAYGSMCYVTFIE